VFVKRDRGDEHANHAAQSSVAMHCSRVTRALLPCSAVRPRQTAPLVLGEQLGTSHSRWFADRILATAPLRRRKSLRHNTSHKILGSCGATRPGSTPGVRIPLSTNETLLHLVSAALSREPREAPISPRDSRLAAHDATQVVAL
jgi:hypothetical protein